MGSALSLIFIGICIPGIATNRPNSTGIAPEDSEAAHEKRESHDKCENSNT
jgi:hypothetical protein